MKRYLSFAGGDSDGAYPPRGGINDLIGDYSTIEEAKKISRCSEEYIGVHGYFYDISFDWAHIFDTQEKKIILKMTLINTNYDTHSYERFWR